MSKNDHAHSLRLIDSIQHTAGSDEANAFAAKFPLSKSAAPEKKHAWAKNVSSYLDAHFDPETVISIRKACKCNDGKSIANKLLKYMNSTDDIRQFVAAFNAKETFARLEYISDNKILFCYPQCYCACVKRVQGDVPRSWCYCTLGNAQSIFTALFNRNDVKVSLRSSIKTGGDQCVIEVEW